MARGAAGAGVSPGGAGMTPEKVNEVHNVWTVYGLDERGEPADKIIAEKHRPQDWGHPRWTYQRYKFAWVWGGTRWVNHAHCWTDRILDPGAYAALFASLIVQMLHP